MSIAEGVQARVAYKAYATGVISSNSQPTSSSDPGASSAQVLRRVACSLDLNKDTYQSGEINLHQQVSDFRHGVKRVTGSITGELSPGTYWDFIEAACRGTEASVVTANQSDFTSIAADNTTSKFTAAGGNPHTKGFRVGDVIRFTNLSDSDNNSKNFVITSLSGSNNRDIGVYPPPDTMSADSAFSVTTVGKSVYVPVTGHVSRKFGVEVYHTDADLHRFFTECRVGGVRFNLPPTGIAGIEIPMMGRDMETASGGSSPFFTSPTDPTSTGLLAAVNGLIRVGGTNLGVVTGAQINLDMAMSAEPVVGQNYVPEIFLGRANVTGQLTFDLEDLTLINYFKNETEVEVLLYLAASSASAPDAMTIYMPRVKLGGAGVGVQGEAGQIITAPFQALKYATAGTGIEATTIRFTDTAA